MIYSDAPFLDPPSLWATDCPDVPLSGLSWTPACDWIQKVCAEGIKEPVDTPASPAPVTPVHEKRGESGPPRADLDKAADTGPGGAGEASLS